MSVFKQYLRMLLRELELFKKTFDAGDYEELGTLLDMAIKDTKDGIDDE